MRIVILAMENCRDVFKRKQIDRIILIKNGCLLEDLKLKILIGLLSRITVIPLSSLSCNNIHLYNLSFSFSMWKSL